MSTIRIILAIALCPSFAFSQVGFERYQVEDGLTQNSILALLQDGSGYIWIGTEDGLKLNAFVFYMAASPLGRDNREWQKIKTKGSGH